MLMDPRTLTNYLWDTPNPHGLAGPPAWFLVQMHALDPRLVIFPSAQEAVYRIARRAQQSAGALRALEHYPDTTVYVQHKLVPVTSLLPFTNWSPVVLEDLHACSIERLGGSPDAYADWLDAEDARQAAQIQREEDREVEALVSDAYSDVVWATGRRVSQEHGPRRPRTTAYQSLVFDHDTGGSAIFVGDRHRSRIDPQTRTVGRGPIVLASA